MPGPFMSVQPRRTYSLQGPGELSPDLVYGYHNGWLIDRTVAPKGPVKVKLASAAPAPGPNGPFDAVSNTALPAPGITDVWSRGGSTVTLTFYLTTLSSSLPFQPLLFKGVSTNQQWTLAVYSDGNIRFDSAGYFGNSSMQTTGGVGPVSAGRWYTLSIVNEPSGSHSMYLDGRLILTSGGFWVTSTTDSTQPMTIGFGMYSNGSFTSSTGLQISHLSVAYRALPASRVRELALNPNSMFKGPARNLSFMPDTYGAITVPGSDVAVSGWTATPGPSLYKAVNEFIPNDSDYITSPFAGTGSPVILELGRPLEAGQWNVRFRANFVGSFSSSVLVRLLDASNNVVGTAAAELLTGSMQTHTVAVDTTATAYRVSLEAV